MKNKLLKFTTIPAPHFCTLFLLIYVLNLSERFLFPENTFFLTTYLIFGIDLIWWFSVGSSLISKRKLKNRFQFILFIVSLTVLLLSNLVSNILVKANAAELVFAKNISDFSSLIGFIFALYFLAKNLTSLENKKPDLKTFFAFFVPVLGIWNLSPRLKNIFSPNEKVKTYDSKVKNTFISLVILYYVISLFLVGKAVERAVNKALNETPSVNENLTNQN